MVLQRNSPGVHEGGSQLGVAPVLQANAELHALLVSQVRCSPQRFKS